MRVHHPVLDRVIKKCRDPIAVAIVSPLSEIALTGHTSISTSRSCPESARDRRRRWATEPTQIRRRLTPFLDFALTESRGGLLGALPNHCRFRCGEKASEQ